MVVDGESESGFKGVCLSLTAASIKKYLHKKVWILFTSRKVKYGGKTCIKMLILT